MVSVISKLKQFVRGIEELEAEVISRVRSEDGATYDATFREIGGSQRTFTQIYEWYNEGHSTPKPAPGDRATIRVNLHGEVIYAGSPC